MKPEKYSLKAQLVEELVKATREAVNAQAQSPSEAQLILAFHLILKDWAVHPIPAYAAQLVGQEPSEWANAEGRVDALFRELHDAVIEQHETVDNETATVAKELCRLANRNLMLPDGDDNPNINQVVMGFEGTQVPVADSRKRLACLVYPLKPLWAHYIRDATDALHAVTKATKALGGKKDAV